jgi:hypothetical protein
MIVVMFDEYASAPAIDIFRPLAGCVSEYGTSALRIVFGILQTVFGVITPSSRPAPKMIALCTEPGSTTNEVAASSRSAAG